MKQKKDAFSILLIDADRKHHSQFRKQFAEDLEHPTEIDVTTSLKDAVQKIKQKSYRAILADCYLPEGEDIADLLGELNREKVRIPVVLVVGPGEEARAHRALKAGATDYLVRSEETLQNLPERLWSLYRNYELSQNHAGLAEQLDGENQKLLEVNEKLRELSIRDELTGLFNHRQLQEKLVEEFTRAVRYGHPLSCMMIDLDQFRSLNENLGHPVGDVLLKEAAEILLESCRLSDLIARFGGEEFAILLPHVDYGGALELGQRLRTLFAEHTFLPDSHRLNVTVSIGISCFPDDSIRHRSDLLNFADQALTRAKAAGRNMVSLYRDLLPTIGEALPHLKISQEKVLEFQKRLSEIADTARRAYIESSRAMVMALESKDSFTAGHAGSVAGIAMKVAEAMGLPLDEAEVVEHAGLLHDIGKICISDEVLLKPGRFTLAEYEAMKQHPYLGYRILKPVKFLQQEATLVLHHHEWFNGEGYPCRLSRYEIPFGSRIVSVVDSYDTMRHAGGRYKKTVSIRDAVNELIACSGTQFDPEVVQAFVQVLLMRKELSPDAYDKKRLQETLATVDAK